MVATDSPAVVEVGEPAVLAPHARRAPVRALQREVAVLADRPAPARRRLVLWTGGALLHVSYRREVSESGEGLTEVPPWTCLLMSKEAAALGFFQLRPPPKCDEPPSGPSTRVPCAWPVSVPRASLKIWCS